ncbi:hypothetical protein MUN81_20895 [Hymenobacter sp. 5317J-9]|nr:hypothetical protein [Hymenobacter sp. 5317J-9]UOQ97673.1 hypothetical protein MUN81_20895 [Hymenobacter sp. 5317J-9]
MLVGSAGRLASPSAIVAAAAGIVASPAAGGAADASVVFSRFTFFLFTP